MYSSVYKVYFVFFISFSFLSFWDTYSTGVICLHFFVHGNLHRGNPPYKVILFYLHATSCVGLSYFLQLSLQLRRRSFKTSEDETITHNEAQACRFNESNEGRVFIDRVTGLQLNALPPAVPVHLCRTIISN